MDGHVDPQLRSRVLPLAVLGSLSTWAALLLIAAV